MRFEISLVIVLLTCYSMLTAQATFGIRSGGVLSTHIYKYDFNVHNTKSKPGYDLAITSEFPISKNISFNPELHWIEKGSIAIIDFPEPETNYPITLDYLEMPLLINFKIGHKTKYYALGGPSVGYLLSKTNLYNKTEFGFHIGGGIDFGSIIVDFRFIRGLTDVIDYNTDQEMRNSGFGAGIGYQF